MAIKGKNHVFTLRIVQIFEKGEKDYKEINFKKIKIKIN